MDLEVSLSCYWMLITKLQSHVSELRLDADSKLNFDKKLKLLLKRETLQEQQKMVERQTIALTLLLTACNCNAISEQKLLLEQTTSRKIIQRVRDDSSSLFVRRDSLSLYSRMTGISSLSKISKVFDFDHELFITKPYERALRDSLKNTVETLRQQQRIKRIFAGDTSEEVRRSQRSDTTLELHPRQLRKESKFFLLGYCDCGDTVVKQMKMASNGYTSNELSLWARHAKQSVIYITKSMVEVVGREGLNLDEQTKAQAKLLSEEISQNQAGGGDFNLTEDATRVACELWKSGKLRPIFSGSTDIVIGYSTLSLISWRMHNELRKRITYQPTVIFSV